jgi:polyhydroxyalkanoate synthesis regulator phasin
MRRLDTLECERAMEELRLLVDEGQLTREQAQPAVQALFRRGMSDEAAKLFDESCLRLAQTIVVVHEPEGDEWAWLPFGDEE